jgi:riboflavin kinase / FMN adenylyltransferase
MKVIQNTNLNDLNILDPTILTIGNFDGVHFGHQFLLKKLLNLSQKLKLDSTVLTFNPNPKEFFLQKKVQKSDNLDFIYEQNLEKFKNIMTLPQKIKALEKIGISQLIILKFDHNLANLSAEDFVQKILIQKVNMKFLVVGKDFCLGKNKRGNSIFLKNYAKKTQQFRIRILERQKINNQEISSTLIRKLLV